MWKLSDFQRKILRAGSLFILLGVPILGVAALSTLPALLSDEKVIRVAEGQSEFELPDRGLFGGSTTVYGSVTTPERPSPAELGCRLLSEDGDEYNSAKLQGLWTLTMPEITVDGTELSPLFEVAYESGDRVQCDHLDQVAPVGFTAPNAFGSSSGIVFMMAVSGALTCLVVGGVGFFVLSPRGEAANPGGGWRF
ncbi:hypothetical protein [Nocardioides gilvus]|uniref:hypothetical protein n=1 Tax=Nocardioides gilvus TaxID=1735589 RepID=UPI000D74231C|nr:hypothetical protein [Nocardioides gilvus]